MPEEWLDPPTVWPHLRFYWDAFSVLGTARQLGMVEGPIPFTAIDCYARRYRIDDLEAFELFLAIIRGMDAEYLSFRADAAKRAQELNTQFRETNKPPKPMPKMLAGEERA